MKRRASGRLEAPDSCNGSKTGADRPLGAIFIGHRPAEIGEHAVAKKLRDVASKPPDRARDGFLIDADELMHVFRIEPRRQARGPDHVAKEDAEQPEVGTGLAPRPGPARFWRQMTERPQPLMLRLELKLRFLGVVQLGDGRKHDLAVTERDAERLQVGVVQVRQGAKVDVVFGKDLGIFA